MRSPLTLAAVALVLGTAVLAAGPQQVPIRVQPIVGVPTAPAPSTGSDDQFFDDNIVQEVRLTLNSKDWQTLKDNYLDNTYYPADFKWRGETVRNIGIRSRGTGSRSYSKPGLRVDFDRYNSSQKFLGLKSFVLRNNVQDASGMHERLSMLLFRQAGFAAPREAHTRLYVNDAYAGLYTIVESLDKGFVKRAVGEDSGYLYEYDYPVGAAPYYFEDRGDDPAAYVPQPFKPQTHESDPRPEFVAQMVEAINRSSDAAFRTAAGEYVDFVQFLQHVAGEVFVGDYDGFLGNVGMNNFYLYRFDNSNRFVFFPWDKSEAFLAGPGSSIWHNLLDVPDAQRNRLMSRVLAVPDLYAAYLDILDNLANVAATPAEADPRGWLEREVEREANQIRAATQTDTLKPFTNADFEEEVADLIGFARDRSATVKAEVAASRR